VFCVVQTPVAIFYENMWPRFNSGLVGPELHHDTFGDSRFCESSTVLRICIVIT